jgi:hypothetical protein
MSFLSACGGNGDSGDDTTSTGGQVTTTQPTDPALLGTTEFEQVCGGGTVSLAPPYDKKVSAIHPLLAFEGQDPEYEYASLSLPEGWQPDALGYAKTELVACLNRVKEKKLTVCEGYESDDFPEPFDVEVYGATYDITVYESNTGAEVASGSFTTDDKECPFVVFYDEDEDPQREYADTSDQVRGFVKKYVLT